MKKVLIIEDDKEISNMYKFVLENSYYEVEVEYNGLNGLAKAVEFKPDVIILDIMMPQTNGFEVLESIKKHSSLDCKIIVNSNLSSEKDERESIRLGADKYLRKSEYTPAQVIAEVEKVLLGNNN